MCLLALFFRVVEDAPVVVGANREEYYARPADPPQLLDGPIRILAGRDPQGGGTWLGVNEHGVLVAVTNRKKTTIPTPARSRGLLTREALGFATAAAAVDFATKELDKQLYAGCNLVIADSERAVVLQGGDWLRVRPLPPGLHVLANRDVNDESDPRVGHALGWLYRQPYTTAVDCLEALKELCSNPGIDAPPMCLHGLDKGTVSSSLIALRQPLSRSSYLHAQGPPDRTPYEDVSSLFAPLTVARSP
jgi:uncharacterized protein with NRDE domain